jgi:hypothetical protein
MPTVLVDDREAGLEIGYAATDWSSPVNYEVYEAALEDWTVKTIVRDGEPIGAAYFKDGEVHVSIVPEWRKKWATKGVIAQLFAGKGTFSRIAPGHDYMFDIFRRLGFNVYNDGVVARAG